MLRIFFGVAAIALLAACNVSTSTSTSNTPDAPDRAALVERGKQLTDSIGLCGDCHTQRLPTGQLDLTRNFYGAVLPFKNLHPQPWAPTTPALAGLPAGYTEAQLASFLQDGLRPDGSRPLPPMPEYRLSKEDAEAMAAYFASLPKPPAP